MNASQARRRTQKMSTNVERSLSPRIMDKIDSASAEGLDYVVLSEYRWNKSDIPLLTKLGYKVVVVPRFALLGTITTDLLVHW